MYATGFVLELNFIVFKHEDSRCQPCLTHSKSQTDCSSNYYSFNNDGGGGGDSDRKSLCHNNDRPMASSDDIIHYFFQLLPNEKGSVTKKRQHGVWSQQTLTAVSDLTSLSITDKSRCGEEEQMRWCIYVKHFPNSKAL